MPIDLRGRTALVTGSTAGIGLAIAGGLAAAGATRADTIGGGVETFLKEIAAQTGEPEAKVAADFVKTHRPSSLTQRFASVEQIANMVVCVASPQAAATNGAAMHAEGGIIRSIY